VAPWRRRLARAWTWWAARPTLSAAVIYALLSLVFVGQGLLPGRTLSNADMLWSEPPWTASRPPGVRFGGANFELADVTAVFLPFFDHSKHEVPHAPLWNAHIMAGRPFLADGQSAVFSPFTLPVYLLPLWKALAVMAMLKLFVAAFGTYLLGRQLGMRFGGALLAGIVYAFGTFFVVWLGWPLTNVVSLLPWLLLLSELVIRRPEALPGAGLAALVAFAFLGGHPETSFHTMVAVVVFFAFRLLTSSRAGRERQAVTRPAVVFGLALAGGTAIAAVVLLPLAEILFHSADYSRRLSRPPGHADARYLGAFFLFDYWGRPTQTPLVADLVSNRGFYAGGITLMLAAVGLVLRPTPMRLAFSAFGALSLGVVLGANPLFTVVTALPGFRTAHNFRLVFFVLFALAMLAGWGLDELSVRERRQPARRRLAIAAAVGIFCVPIVWLLVADTISLDRFGPALKVAWGFADPPAAIAGRVQASEALRAIGRTVPERTTEIVRLSALLEWLPLAGAALALVAIRLGALGKRVLRAVPVAAFVSLAIALLVADLFRANMGFNPAIPLKHAQQPVTPAIRYLQSRTPNRFAAFNRPGIGQPLEPDIAMRYGLYDARGYDYPVERRFDSFWRATAGVPGDFIETTQRAVPTRKGLHAMSLLSVTDIMQGPGDPAVHLPGLRLAYSGPDARVYRNTQALPRAFLVPHQRSVSGADAALAATVDPRFDARRVAVTERRIPGLDEYGGTGKHDAGTARLVSYGNEHVVAMARAKARSLLVLTDAYYPGWKATLDGHSVPIERVDYVLRAVVLPPGSHRVEFRYEPMSWRIGWMVSSVALVAVAGVALVGWRRRRAGRGLGR
jgi:hypothetical protein